jgi:CRISPR-associated protein Cmr5
MRRTKEQLRASHAWSAISGLDRLTPENKKKIAVAIKGLPVRIQASGLGQAMTFLRAKKDFRELEGIIVHWLLNDFPMTYQRPQERDDPSAQLIERIIQGDATMLRRWTEESLAYLPWLSRFAEGAGMMQVAGNRD